MSTLLARKKALIGTAAPFVPTDVAGLVLWLDPVLSTLTKSTNDVTQWDDLSGAGHHATGVAGSTFLDNGTTINGRKALIGDPAADRRMNIANLLSNEFKCLFMVLAFNTVPGVDSWAYGSGGTSISVPGVGAFITSARVVRARITDGTTQDLHTGPAAPTAPFVLMHGWAIGGEHTLRVFDTVVTDTNALASDLGTNDMWLGTSDGRTDLAMADLKWGTVLAYNALPSAYNRQRIINYLAKLHGITAPVDVYEAGVYESGVYENA